MNRRRSPTILTLQVALRITLSNRDVSNTNMLIRPLLAGDSAASENAAREAVQRSRISIGPWQ